jgi:hypothetical protein
MRSRLQTLNLLRNLKRPYSSGFALKFAVIPSEVEESRGVTDSSSTGSPPTPLRFARDDDACGAWLLANRFGA